MPTTRPRFVVIGTTGSGKSTLAQRLSKKLGISYIELDELYWRPHWTHVSTAEFRSLVDTVTRTQAWALAGNYNAVRDIAWARATVLIWLDYSAWTVFWRLTFRTFRRCLRKELLWGSNYESLTKQFKLWSEESIWHWFFKTYWRRKREIPETLAHPDNKHLIVLRFKKVKETELWLQSL